MYEAAHFLSSASILCLRPQLSIYFRSGQMARAPADDLGVSGALVEAATAELKLLAGVGLGVGQLPRTT